MKNIKTKSMVFILLLVFNFIPLNVYGETKVYSFEEAFERATSVSISIDRYSKQLRKIREQGNSLSNEAAYYNPNDPFSNITFYNLAQSALTINNTTNLLRETIEYEKSVLKMQLTSILNNIDTINRDINFTNKKIAKLNEDIKLNDIKVNFGTQARHSQTSLNNERQALTKSLQELNLKLEKENLELNKLLKHNDTNYEIERPKSELIELNTLEKEKQGIISRSLNKDIRVQGINNNIDLKQSEVELYAFNFLPMSTSGDTISREPYEVKLIDKALISTDLEETRTSVRNTVSDKYQMLKTINHNISTLNQRKQTIKDELELMKIRYNTGLITNEPIKDLEFTLIEIEKAIEELLQNYVFIQEMLKDPFTAGLPAF